MPPSSSKMQNRLFVVKKLDQAESRALWFKICQNSENSNYKLKRSNFKRFKKFLGLELCAFYLEQVCLNAIPPKDASF